MARWEPDARGRLAQAALELYAERGFEHTTVAEIAERAGLTERTFFRHYADKREVLFGGAAQFQDAIVGTTARAPESLAPIDAVATGIAAAGDVMPSAGAARQRRAIIAANIDLQERELSKLASLSAALTDTLRERGLSDVDAGLTAEIGIALFRIAYARWLAEGNERGFAELVHESVGKLKVLV
jgi:AcrR family transcriptional regulator